MIWASKSLAGLGPNEMKLFDRDEHRKAGQEGVGAVQLRAFHQALGTGAGSEGLQLSMLANLKSALEGLEESHDGSLPLLSWVKRTVTQTSMKTLYGAENPLNDQSVEDAFWYTTYQSTS